MSYKKKTIVVIICSVVLVLYAYFLFENENYISSPGNTNLTERELTSNENRVDELESEIRDLKRQLNDRSNQRPTESNTNNQQAESDGHSVFDERKVNADVIRRQRLTDPHFNVYYRVQIKNNYNKPIASVRIGSNGWVKRRVTAFSDATVRQQTEAVVVSIPPDETREITLRKSWDYFSMVVDAVTFSDGTSSSSTPGVFNY